MHPEQMVNRKIGRFLGSSYFAEWQGLAGMFKPLAEQRLVAYITANSGASASTPEAHRNSNGPRARFFMSAFMVRASCPTESSHV